jgi:cell division protein FtsB
MGRVGDKSAKASGAPFREDIAEGTKKLEEQSKAVAKLAAEWVKLRDTGESQAIAHQKRMISITGTMIRSRSSKRSRRWILRRFSRSVRRV